MKKILGLLLMGILFLTACGGSEEPQYEITSDRHDEAGQWYVDVKSEASTEEEFAEIIDHLNHNKFDKTDGDVTALYVQFSNEDKVVANGVMALLDKGIAQTGLEKKLEPKIELLK